MVMGMVLGLLPVLLSFGAVNSLVPLMIIIILIAAAAAMTRGWSALSLFGIDFLAGVAGIAGGSTRGSLRGKSAFTGGKPTGSAYRKGFEKAAKSAGTYAVVKSAKKKQEDSMEKSAAQHVFENTNFAEKPKEKGGVRMAVEGALGRARDSFVLGTVGYTSPAGKLWAASKSLKENKGMSGEARVEIGSSMTQLRNKLGISAPTHIEETLAVSGGQGKTVFDKAGERFVEMKKQGNEPGTNYMNLVMGQGPGGNGTISRAILGSNAAKFQAAAYDKDKQQTYGNAINNIKASVASAGMGEAEARQRIHEEIGNFRGNTGAYSWNSQRVEAIMNSTKESIYNSVSSTSPTRGGMKEALGGAAVGVATLGFVPLVKEVGRMHSRRSIGGYEQRPVIIEGGQRE